MANHKEDKDHSQVEEHILKRFDLQEYKGKGAYGIVWKAYDRKTKQIVALKKVFDAFQNSTDAQRTYREVVFLKQLNDHDNIIKLISVIKSDNSKDLYMVFEFMETDLHRVIRAKLLTPLHVQYVIYQLLKALKYIHSGQLIHRDLKPANLLVNSNCKLKVADFGLARSISISENNEENPIMTEYVATRWYRAPEILFGSKLYSKSVDMWSVGCILGEMIVGKALFPGSSTLDQIEKIIDLLGKPSHNDIADIDAPLAFSILDNISANKKITFAQCFKGATDLQIDFLRKILVYDPFKRLTVEQALLHPYLKDFKSSEPETTMEQPITIPFNDNKKLKMIDYRNALYSGLIFKKTPYHQQKYETDIQGSKTEVDQQNKLDYSHVVHYVHKKPKLGNNDEEKSKNCSQKSKSLYYTQDVNEEVHTCKQILLDADSPQTVLIKYYSCFIQSPSIAIFQQNKLYVGRPYQREFKSCERGTDTYELADSQGNSKSSPTEKQIGFYIELNVYNINYNPIRRQSTMYTKNIQLQSKKQLHKRDSRSLIHPSKTPDLTNYSIHQTPFRSKSQIKQIQISRSNSKQKSKGSIQSPYNSDQTIQQNLNTILANNFNTLVVKQSKIHKLYKFQEQKASSAQKQSVTGTKALSPAMYVFSDALVSKHQKTKSSVEQTKVKANHNNFLEIRTSFKKKQ